MIRQIYQGRTGNLLLQLVGMSILSEKLNLKVENYKSIELFEPLGFKVFSEGKNRIDHLEIRQDDSLMSLLQGKNDDNSGILYDGTYQVKDFVIQYKDKIKSHFSNDFQKNDDIFVHIRMGDVSSFNPGFDYYKKSIEKCDYNKGYISSDSPESTIVQSLSKEFSLEICTIDNPVILIDLARKSKNLVLSRGTLSWWMGLLSIADKIFVPGTINYPNKNLDFTGDIFVYEDWIFEK